MATGLATLLFSERFLTSWHWEGLQAPLHRDQARIQMPGVLTVSGLTAF